MNCIWRYKISNQSNSTYKMICWCEWVRNHKKPEQCKGGWTFHKFDSKRATIFFLRNLPPQLRSIATPLPQLENFMVSIDKQLPNRNQWILIITSKLFLLDSHTSLNSQLVFYWTYCKVLRNLLDIIFYIEIFKQLEISSQRVHLS